MKKVALCLALLGSLVLISCTPQQTSELPNYANYTSFSRYTDPKDMAGMLETLPDDIDDICAILKNQTLHHNLLVYHDVPKSSWSGMSRIWPPAVPILLKTLEEREPHTLSADREIEQRIIGACMLESHLLAGALRYKGIPTRIRAGYFTDIRKNGEHVLEFWRKNLIVKNNVGDMASDDRAGWEAGLKEYTEGLNALNHCTEHWICEYWDEDEGRWRLLDANNTFLKAHSGIEIGYRLPEEYFEYSYESWKRIRQDSDIHPDKYAEGEQDGRSHVRSQMLSDFFSLLNYDMAGWENSSNETWEFIKGRSYDQLTPAELEDLDALAELLAGKPDIQELVDFYHSAETIVCKASEGDPYCSLNKLNDSEE